jgi:hypothetical protein
MRILLFFSFLFFFSQTTFSQKKTDTFLTCRLSVGKKDFFTGLALGCKTETTVESLTFETGVIRSFFQYRFFPRIGVSSMWIVSKNQRFISGPLFQYHFSTVQINKFAGKNGRVNCNELLVGWSTKTNGKIYFSTDILVGYQLENSFNVLELKRKTIGALGYSFVCGVGYEF